MANGDRLTSLCCCRGLHLDITDEVFCVDCYGLVLASFDMVLGI
jgi:hypothetical protein